MDLPRLHEILRQTTIQLRKGGEVEERMVDGVEVVDVYAMPPVHAARPDVELIDVEFITIGVDKGKAETQRDSLVGILRTYPDPQRLAQGPSYIEVGAELGDQGLALQLFALGKALGLWDIITPASLGFSGDEARDLAGRGFVMITGFLPLASTAGAA